MVASRLAARPAESLERARRLVEQYGGDTLSYFALRDDKRFFFNGDTLIAYAVYQGVCLVSPDPIGPLAERWVAWTAFRTFADEHGWAVAVMGAGEAWLPIYRASGMHDLYVGDEAVVDVRRFNLEGGRNKGLRQAVNRIAKYGYRTEFHDPAHIEPALEAKLRRLMTESRRGEVERGFSMTLGRIFHPEDKGLLLDGVLRAGRRARGVLPVRARRRHRRLLARPDASVRGQASERALGLRRRRDDQSTCASTAASGSASTSPRCARCWPASGATASAPASSAGSCRG